MPERGLSEMQICFLLEGIGFACILLANSLMLPTEIKGLLTIGGIIFGAAGLIPVIQSLR